MSDVFQEQCSSLRNSLNLGNLIKDKEAFFEINSIYDDDNLSEEVFGMTGMADDEFIEKAKEKLNVYVADLLSKPFNELRQTMTKLPDCEIYKEIFYESEGEIVPPNSKVTIHYSSYYEKNTTPYDSSVVRNNPLVFRIDEKLVLYGLEKAVLTMKAGEESCFLIPHDLLFGEMGCPPRIKPKSDVIFIIKMLNFIPVGDKTAIDELSEEDKIKFSFLHEKILKVHANGVYAFKMGLITEAISSFLKSVDALNKCQPSNYNEKQQQKELLLKLHTNLAVCYNKNNEPRESYKMCTYAKIILEKKPTAKILYNEGQALRMMGEFTKAKKSILQAQQMEPTNTDITKELKLLSDKIAKYDAEQKTIWTRAMKLDANPKPSEE